MINSTLIDFNRDNVKKDKLIGFFRNRVLIIEKVLDIDKDGFILINDVKRGEYIKLTNEVIRMIGNEYAIKQLDLDSIRYSNLMKSDYGEPVEGLIQLHPEEYEGIGKINKKLVKQGKLIGFNLGCQTMIGEIVELKNDGLVIKYSSTEQNIYLRYEDIHIMKNEAAIKIFDLEENTKS